MTGHVAERDLLQLAMVRLRLEGVPFRLVHRRDHADVLWPFGEDSVLLLCRTTLEFGDSSVGTGTIAALHVMSDGVERPLTASPATVPFQSMALATRGWWMSSGWVP